jgi:hypothetical protein
MIKYDKAPFLSDPVFYLAIALLCISLSNAWWSGEKSIGIDYYNYWVAGQALGKENIINLYSEKNKMMLRDKFLSLAELSSVGGVKRQLYAAKSPHELELTSTPLMYSLFAGITIGDYEWDYRNFRILCLIVILISLITLCRMFEIPLATTMLMICLLTWLSEPYISDVRVGNVNQLLVGFLTLFLWLKQRTKWRLSDLFCGFVLGFALMFKPTISIIIVLLTALWLIDKQYRTVLLQAVGLCISVFVALLISRYYFESFQCWIEWLEKLKSIDSWPVPLGIAAGNYSLSRLIAEWTGHDLSLALLICLVIVTVVLAWLGRNRSREVIDVGFGFNREAAAVGLGCVIMLLGSKLAWLHYYVLTVPLLLYLYRQEKGSDIHFPDTKTRRIIVMIVIVLYSLQPILCFIGKNEGPRHIAVIFSTGTVMLLATAWLDLYKGMKRV